MPFPNGTLIPKRSNSLPPSDPRALRANADDSWFCRVCFAARVAPRAPRGVGPFAALLQQLDAENPRIFSLPAELRNYFKGGALFLCSTLTQWQPARTAHTWTRLYSGRSNSRAMALSRNAIHSSCGPRRASLCCASAAVVRRSRPPASRWKTRNERRLLLPLAALTNVRPQRGALSSAATFVRCTGMWTVSIRPCPACRPPHAAGAVLRIAATPDRNCASPAPHTTLPPCP